MTVLAINLLRKNGIQANKDQASVILDFFYLIAKTMPKPELGIVDINPREKSNKRIDDSESETSAFIK